MRGENLMQYVNLGCGARCHPDWVNIDIVPLAPGVIAYDLARGIPLPDQSCDAVYHSAVLEHLRRKDATLFLRECFRVLKPGAVLRVATPDLERICRLYLEKLEAALTGDKQAAADYEWIMLELYDQSVREQSGGAMIEYLHRDTLINESFVYERIGEEGRKLREQLLQPRRRSRLRHAAGIARRSLVHVVLRLLLGSSGIRALEIGKFRLAGEVHQWMYDRYSLSEMLTSAGFTDIIEQSAIDSRISGWGKFHLDTRPDGTVIKPDSLFMEAVRPIV